LAEIEQERVQKTIEQQAKIIAGKLRFETSPEIYVHDNTIVLGNQRIVARMS
jgi:hypothetical protein